MPTSLIHTPHVLQAYLTVLETGLILSVEQQNGVLFFEEIQKKVVRKRWLYADNSHCWNYDDKQRCSPWQQHRRGTEAVQLG